MQSTELFSARLEHKKIIEPTWSNEPTETSEIPPLHEEIMKDQEEDKGVSCVCE